MNTEIIELTREMRPQKDLLLFEQERRGSCEKKNRCCFEHEGTEKKYRYAFYDCFNEKTPMAKGFGKIFARNVTQIFLRLDEKTVMNHEFSVVIALEFFIQEGLTKSA